MEYEWDKMGCSYYLSLIYKKNPILSRKKRSFLNSHSPPPYPTPQQIPSEHPPPHIHLFPTSLTRTVPHRPPPPIHIPNASLGIIPDLTPTHEPKAKIFLLAGPAALECRARLTFANVPSETLDVVDEHAQAVIAVRRRGPRECDIR